jgi:hypothetical protein
MMTKVEIEDFITSALISGLHRRVGEKPEFSRERWIRRFMDSIDVYHKNKSVDELINEGWDAEQENGYILITMPKNFKSKLNESPIYFKFNN